jgi:protein kinase A
MDVVSSIIEDTPFLGGAKIFEEGSQVEPCLYFVREGEVTLTTSDGKVKQKVGPGGYFGVEQLLIPPKKNSKVNRQDSKVLLPAQWTVTVSGSKPCVCGILPLVEIQAILDNNGKAKKEEPVFDEECPLLKKRAKLRNTVRSNVKLDDLEMISVLGDGEFGEVWLVSADVDGDKQKFALKVQTTVDSDVALIKREIGVNQALNHPFIADLVHTYETEDSIYMLMGLVTGGELWDVVHREDDDGNWTSGLPEASAKFYGLIVADTLAYIHSQKYVYRDLKPENVMIDSEGYPVIVDFGFAKICTENTYTLCGTPNYVSPEIVRNIGHGAGADHWALGVLIYEMICGEHPFFTDGMDQMMVFEAIVRDKPFPLPKSTSASAVGLINRPLEKDSSQRLGMLAGGENEILTHKWFDLDLSKLRAKEVKAPWIPPGDL